jgi:hypothetical protein
MVDMLRIVGACGNLLAQLHRSGWVGRYLRLVDRNNRSIPPIVTRFEGGSPHEGEACVCPVCVGHFGRCQCPGRQRWLPSQQVLQFVLRAHLLRPADVLRPADLRRSADLLRPAELLPAQLLRAELLRSPAAPPLRSPAPPPQLLPAELLPAELRADLLRSADLRLRPLSRSSALMSGGIRACSRVESLRA